MPWYVSALFGGGIWIVINGVLPALLGPTLLGLVLMTALRPLSMVALFIFVTYSLMLLVRNNEPRPHSTSITVPQQRKPEPKTPKHHHWVTIKTPQYQKTEPDIYREHKQADVPPVPTSWSLPLLRRIEWKRLEELTAAYFREKKFRTETLPAGADGGIDVKLYAEHKPEPFAIVQCKAWTTQKVGVKPVRELLGVMASERVAKGIFVSSGLYTDDAIAFAKSNPINLITGPMLVTGILALSPEAQARLMAIATEGDYTTPTCASCGVKMVERHGKRGAFWGCVNYPRCKTVLNKSSSAENAQAT